MVLDQHENVLLSSDLQFGFKPEHSTSMCSFAVKEVMHIYYINKNQGVCAMLLDASKAFDRVQYVKLFRLLTARGTCPLMVRFLATLYTHQRCQIQWCNQISETFTVSNGVKQGGVLSPVLFTVYVDELPQRLKASGMGGYIGNTFLGSVGYADDIILLCPTLHSLRVMLKVAQSFSDAYDINFNIAKSELVVYGKKGVMECSVTFNGATIVSKGQAKHIGNIIGWMDG